ncbi:TIGR01244 family sulfur transferase [Sphingomonas turrisvirgatae]|uniref:TIGR01244 family protein n=1 Tax=Sphingomonas turrisvirgatae TaxID=1888892 RepID=A0A1E3LQM7_9SPHN|nr:TIGR01244 family sulfur transferase [Sphingomonas turrisvirgatae]ODP36072.1 TIGR01244 family protein [Sphingomonas turrisvirgatae]
MADIRRINDQISVAPQIEPADLADIAQQGFVAVINNRPDDEDAGQPAGEAVRAAAEAQGMLYHAIPVTQAGFSANQVEAMRAAIDAANGPVLAYCRSGTRSTNLWALAQASKGDRPDHLIEQAAGAGYNLTGLRPLLDQLSGKA